MMDIAFIAPPKLTEYICPLGTSLMGLAHLTNVDTSYAEQLGSLSHSRHLTIDNSLMELGTSVSIDDLLLAAIRTAADEVILPDVFQGCGATLRGLREILPIFDLTTGYPRSKFMAVPQGRTISEWLYCYDTIYNEFVLTGHVQTIGVPKILATYDQTFGRICALQSIAINWPERIDEHEWHLLGVWNFGPDSMDEPSVIAKKFPWVRSVDTSLPVYFGLDFNERPDIWNDIAFEDLSTARFRKIVDQCLRALDAIRDTGEPQADV
jgi:hypothetical protein